MRRNRTKNKRLTHLLGTKKYRDKLIADKSHDLGIDCEQEGKSEIAVIAYSRAIRFNPKDDSSLYNRGNIFKNFGEVDKALADYNQALLSNPNRSKLTTIEVEFTLQGVIKIRRLMTLLKLSKRN